MKKKIVFLICVFFLTTSAMAATCKGGAIITANNGTTFCKSDNKMNWWSAFTWCESQGRTLAELSKMCPGVSQAAANEEGDCPNLQGTDDGQWKYAWSSLDSNTNGYGAIIVDLSSGAIVISNRNNYGFAFCE